ncbi:hypothetical protein B0813_002940 [Candidatus Fervidibacteria bacterium JGI MDM2 SSWTFF-3-K9]
MAKVKAKATKPVQLIERQQAATNGAKSSVEVRDALNRLRNEVIYPLQTLADLLTESDPAVATRILPQPTLEALGYLLDALVAKAEAILQEHGLSESEGESED